MRRGRSFPRKDVEGRRGTNFPSYAERRQRREAAGGRREEGTGMRESLSNPSEQLMFSCELVDGNGVLPSRRGKDGRGRSIEPRQPRQEVNTGKGREEVDRRTMTTVPNQRSSVYDVHTLCAFKLREFTQPNMQHLVKMGLCERRY